MAFVLTTSALASDDRERAPVVAEAETDAPDGASSAPAPPILPKKLAPRAVPKANVPVSPSTAAAQKPAGAPASEGKKSKTAGAPVEIRTSEDDFAARVGSQAARGGGLLGRYDGVTASKALGDAARLNLVGGFPLASSNDARFDPNRSFYALSLDLAPFDESLEGRIFGVQQRIDEEQERHAVGGEIGFDHARGFGLVSVDYDVDVGNVGQVSLLASTKLDARTTVNAFVDARRYTSDPTAYSALQGQSIASVDQLLDKLSQSELRAPSPDSGAQTRTVTLGASRQLTSRLQLAADVTLKDVIPEDLVPSTSAPDVMGELDYSVHATWKDFLIGRSSTTARLRIAELEDSRRYSGSLGGEYPLLQNLRVGPDLAFEFADLKEQWIYKPSMRFEYLKSRLRLDFQLGLEISDIGVGSAEDRTGMFYRIGYRYDF
jgi:hypothetical protein